MKTFLLCVLNFILGALLMAGLSSYASKVWSYGQLARGRDAMMSAAFKAYGDGDYKEAASLARGANLIARMPDQQWHLLTPIGASFFRFFGAFYGIHVDKNYNAYLVAYLYHAAGDDDRAQPYYDMANAAGTPKEKANKSAKLFLDNMIEVKK